MAARQHRRHVEGRVVRAVVSRYGTPPFTVSHGGGVFTTRLVERGSTDDRALQSLSAAVLSAFGLHEGVSHTEYIRAVDGTWYFLETSARVGGAHIADLVEVATRANFWGGRRSKPRPRAAPAMRLQRIEATTLV